MDGLGETFGSGDHTEISANLFKRRQGSIKVLLGVGGAELDPDSGLSFGYHWIEEPMTVDAFLEQCIGHDLGNLASPSITSTMADSPSLKGKPALRKPFLKYAVLASSVSNSVVSSNILNTLMDAPTCSAPANSRRGKDGCAGEACQ